MFTVLGTWEVIGEVQGERYTAISIDSSGRCGEWGLVGSNMQRGRSVSRGRQREICPLQFDRKSSAAASDHRLFR